MEQRYGEVKVRENVHSTIAQSIVNKGTTSVLIATGNITKPALRKLKDANILVYNPPREKIYEILNQFDQEKSVNQLN